MDTSLSGWFYHGESLFFPQFFSWFLCLQFEYITLSVKRSPTMNKIVIKVYFLLLFFLHKESLASTQIVKICSLGLNEIQVTI